MSDLVLVLGGARSGKSSFAEQIVNSWGGSDVTYIATAQAKDEEMAERIINHQSSRPNEWTTIEESIEVGQRISDLDNGSVVLLDCLTVLISNLLLSEEDNNEQDNQFFKEKEVDIIDEIEQIINRVKENDLRLVIVANEVGQGLVPPYKLGRVYRDIMGRVNQLIASKADEVYITYAGLPVEIKELGEQTRAKFS